MSNYFISGLVLPVERLPFCILSTLGNPHCTNDTHTHTNTFTTILFAQLKNIIYINIMLFAMAWWISVFTVVLCIDGIDVCIWMFNCAFDQMCRIQSSNVFYLCRKMLHFHLNALIASINCRQTTPITVKTCTIKYRKKTRE